MKKFKYSANTKAVFAGTKYTDGKTKDNRTWRRLDVVFKLDDGNLLYEGIFEPLNAFEDSPLEKQQKRVYMKLKDIAEAIMEEAVFIDDVEFKALCDEFSKLVTPKKGAEVYLKLIPDLKSQNDSPRLGYWHPFISTGALVMEYSDIEKDIIAKYEAQAAPVPKKVERPAPDKVADAPIITDEVDDLPF